MLRGTVASFWNRGLPKIPTRLKIARTAIRRSYFTNKIFKLCKIEEKRIIVKSPWSWGNSKLGKNNETISDSGSPNTVINSTRRFDVLGVSV